MCLSERLIDRGSRQNKNNVRLEFIWPFKPQKQRATQVNLTF